MPPDAAILTNLSVPIALANTATSACNADTRRDRSATDGPRRRINPRCPMPDRPRRIPLNPCDYLFYAHHRSQQRRIGGGNVAFMMMDFAGHVSLRQMREALIRTMTDHPATTGTLRVSLIRGRPYWRSADRAEEIEKSAARAHEYFDLRSAPNADVEVDRLCQEQFTPHWNFTLGPPIRLEHYALPGDRTRLCLRWPHAFMDAEGAQRLLAAIGCSKSESGSDGLAPDHQSIDPLAGMGIMQRIRLMRSAPQRPVRLSGHSAVLLAAGPRTRVQRYNYLHRVWTAEDNARLTELSKVRTPPGSGIRARYLAAALVRALDRLYTLNKISTDVYRLPIPVRAADAPVGQAASGALQRPLPGNYLAAPAVSIPRTCVADWALLGETIAAQLERYVKSNAGQADWAKLWLASQLRPWQFERALDLPLGLPDFSTGYSYYGEIDPPLRSFFGLDVLNLWGCAPMAIPPGLNPAFSRFSDCLNFSLAWAEPHIDPAWPAMLADFVEQEALDRPRPA